MTTGKAFSQSRRIAPLRSRLKSLTDALIDQWADNPEAQFYIRHQWAEWVRAAHLIKIRSQRWFYFARWLTVVGATIVPTLVVVGAQTHGLVATVTQASAVILSLLVAAAAAALQVTQMGPRWRLYRRLQFDLERVGAQFYARRGDYAIEDPGLRFALFVDRVEAMLQDSEISYSSQIAMLSEDEKA